MSTVGRALTLVWLRWKLWRHGLRSGTGVLNAAAAVALAVIGAVMSLGLAALMAAITWGSASDGDPETLRVVYLIVLYSLAFFAIVMPLFVGQAKTGFDLARLAIFPMSRKVLYGISIGASLVSGPNLFWYPSLVAVAVFGVLLPDGGRLAGLALLAAVSLVYVVWGNTLLLLLNALTRRRNAKELLGVAGFVVLMLGCFAPALMESRTDTDAIEAFIENARLPPAVAAAASLLPPSLAADGLSRLGSESPAGAFTRLAGLALWAAAGAGLGYLILSRYLLESEGPRRRAPKRTATERARSGLDLARLLPSDVAAVASKDLRYILRSASGKFSLVVMPMLAVLAVALFGKEIEQPIFGIYPRQLTLFGLLFYGSLLSSNMLINSFAWEGGGVQSYFLGPAPLGRVILGKNLGVWLYTGILLVECLLTWILLAGAPDAATLATGVLVLASVLANLTMAGNFVSMLFPVKRSISTVSNSPSQVALLVSFGSLALSAVLVVCLLVAAQSVGAAWAQPLFVAGFLGLQVLAYRLLLRPAAGLLAARRESLMETLQAST